jgi:hypothetical protein
MPGLLTSSYGLISRGQPQPTLDGIEGEQRLTRFRENIAAILSPTKHVLSDEGAYYTAVDSAGRATAAAPTTYSDTAPLLAIQNLDSQTNTTARRIYLDYIRGVETAAGTAGTTFQIQLKIDSTTRGLSAGNAVTPLNVNMDVGFQSIGKMTTFPTTTATGATSRTIVANMTAIPAVTAPIGVGSEFTIFFGGDTAKAFGASGTAGFAASTAPPIILGPGQIIVVNFQILAQSATSSWQLEAGWWER